MILYFDNFITNEPFYDVVYPELTLLRSGGIYKYQSKLDVAKYVLASYSVIPFTKVVIKYTLQDEKKNKEFEEFVYSLWPDAYIIRGRSNCRDKFKESLKLLNSFDDEWVFYAGNCDHVFIDSNLDVLNSCLKKAEELKKKNEFVAIGYSCHTEIFEVFYRGREFRYNDVSLLEDDNKDYIVTSFPTGYNGTIFILSKNLLNNIIEGDDNKYMRRQEEMDQHPPTTIIFPKNELCRHYDGAIHCHISNDFIPALFIPPGFFTNDIKINFGFDKYREGWVNINPLKEKYSFRDANGTDMRIDMDEIPLFWQSRISKYDIQKYDKEKVKEVLDALHQRMII